MHYVVYLRGPVQAVSAGLHDGHEGDDDEGKELEDGADLGGN